MKQQSTRRTNRIRLHHLLTIPAVLAVAACGGGGSSSSGASVAVGAALTSSIVVDVNRSVTAIWQDRSRSRAPTLANMLAGPALAQTAGIEIYFNDSLAGSTDADGRLVVPVRPGTYEICFGGTAGEGAPCTTQEVLPDMVVVISDVDVDATTGGLSFRVVSEAAAEHIVVFQDPDAKHKTLLCHKGRFTISVGTPAARSGHLAHGDSLGACAAPEIDGDGGESTVTTGTGRDGDKAGGPKTGCNGRGNRICTG